MAMVLKNVLNKDVCDLINKEAYIQHLQDKIDKLQLNIQDLKNNSYNCDCEITYKFTEYIINMDIEVLKELCSRRDNQNIENASYWEIIYNICDVFSEQHSEDILLSQSQTLNAMKKYNIEYYDKSINDYNEELILNMYIKYLYDDNDSRWVQIDNALTNLLDKNNIINTSIRYDNDDEIIVNTE
jgi:hypothetical protein